MLAWQPICWAGKSSAGLANRLLGSGLQTILPGWQTIYLAGKPFDKLEKHLPGWQAIYSGTGLANCLLGWGTIFYAGKLFDGLANRFARLANRLLGSHTICQAGKASARLVNCLPNLIYFSAR